MLKFVVVVTRHSSLTADEFRRLFVDTHGPLARAMPGLRKYVQNFAVGDPARPRPAWDAVIELYWDDYDSMQAAWASEAGGRATDHLRVLADLERTTWSVVDEIDALER